jgi:hypothetical protein
MARGTNLDQNPGENKINGPLDLISGSVSSFINDVKTFAQGTNDPILDRMFDGPLAPLDSTSKLPVLTYPQDLGINNQYRYLMRLLIFRQERDKNIQPIIAPNAFDAGRRASQEGRINTNVINGTSTLALATALGAIGARNFVTATANTLAQKTNSKLLEAGVGVASTALQTGLAAYVAGSLDQDGVLQQSVTTQPLSYINLYMPDGLNFVDRHDYDAVSVTDALGLAGAVGTGTPLETVARIAEGSTLGGVRLLGENITNLTLYNQGYALNPQLQVLFKGSKNREFVFTFKFVPRNSDEAATIDSIIRTLRYHAAPNYQTQKTGNDDINAIDNSRYFIPPSQFEIEFWVMNQSTATPNTKMPRIAQCVLTNVDVNFAPSGQFSAYVDGYPVETQVQLTFTETIVLTKPDIQAGY